MRIREIGGTLLRQTIVRTEAGEYLLVSSHEESLLADTPLLLRTVAFRCDNLGYVIDWRHVYCRGAKSRDDLFTHHDHLCGELRQARYEWGHDGCIELDEAHE
jgi:hypothetical protein